MIQRARAQDIEHAGTGQFRSQLLKWIGNKQRQATPMVEGSMMKQFQVDGRSLESHHVSDCLFLTY